MAIRCKITLEKVINSGTKDQEIDTTDLLAITFHLPDGSVSVSVKDNYLYILSDDRLELRPKAANLVLAKNSR